MSGKIDFKKLLANFDFDGEITSAIPFGSGHINDTYLVEIADGRKFTLQRINHQVFPDPDRLMENFARVTAHIQNKINLSNLPIQTLNLVSALGGSPCFKDENGNFWRLYRFVDNVKGLNILSTPQQAFQVAKSFGDFQNLLVDLPGERLYETIPDFHNTPKRFSDLHLAAASDVCNRAGEIQNELDFYFSQEAECRTLMDALTCGDIPERITHNDTKCNNVLLDELTDTGVCVIDLDTVMPGLAHYDFGDMIRSGSCSAKEDEIDLDKVEMRFDMYEGLLNGYLESAGNFLNPLEVELLPLSGKIITLEIGARFLTDYLKGDVYFKISRPKQNLDRARVHRKLAESITRQMDEMMQLLPGK